MKQEERDAIKNWEEYKQSIYCSTEVDPTMSPADIEKHRLLFGSAPGRMD